jgi:DNA-binding transcriptional ArsR family regulator
MNLRRDVFQAISDPSRRQIALLLVAQAMTAGAIAENFSSTRSAISRHLKILIECGFVSHVRKGREVYYAVNAKKLKEVADFIEQFRALWNPNTLNSRLRR